MKITLIVLLATLLASTVPGICQEPRKPEGGKPVTTETITAPAAATLPATRTITDTKGRAMVGVIVAKTETGIKFRRTSDAKEFDIALETLSEADQAFIAGLVNAPAKKLRVLVLVESKDVLELLQNYKFEPVVMPRTTVPGFGDTSCDISAITPEELAKYDIIWDGKVPLSQRKEWRALLKKYNGIVCEYFPAVTTRNQWLEDKDPTVMKDKPFVKEDRNFVFFSPYEMAETDQINPDGKKARGVGRTDPTIYKQVIDLALKLRK